MAKITYKDLQYPRETLYYNKIKPGLNSLLDKNKNFAGTVLLQEKDFFKHLSQSIRIDRLQNVKKLIEQLNLNLGTNFKINLFSYNFPVSNALCIPRFTSFQDDKCDQLTIIVSQHFLNNLEPSEQISILGHELAHLLYGHFHIPIQLVLRANLPITDVKDLKSNILKWKTCAEISCDILGFLACNCDHKAFSYAMLKFTSGLSQKVLDENQENLIELFLKQYEDVLQALYDTSLTTHPLTPLRLKVIDALKDLDIVKHFSMDVSQQNLLLYKNQMSQTIDDLVRNIYPEIISERKFVAHELISDLCLAVALSDGYIDQREITAINSIAPGAKQSYVKIKQSMEKNAPSKLISQIIQNAVTKIKSQKYVKTDILNIIRHMITVAASDKIVKESELQTIYDFSKNFGFNKQELAIIMYQMGLK